ncbi:MAG: SAM-dependent DNA methyltransferase [Pseudomonadota bacterium]
MNQEKREFHRLAIQAELDARKSKQERNRLGQFATPTALAQEMIAFGVTLLPKNIHIRFLDPAFGTGSFYSALLEGTPVKRIESAQGFEIDPHYGKPARAFWQDNLLQLTLTDFTRAKSPKEDRVNLLICNPPYVRHHHLVGGEKQRLQKACLRASGMNLSGLAGLYCYFLGLSHQWLDEGGIAGWLIPSEFMDVNYGAQVKQYLLEKVTLLRIHRFDPNDVQFNDALVSSAVVWFKKSKPPRDHRVEFTFGGTHASPAISRSVSANELHKEPKWTRFPRQEVRSDIKGATLSDLFDIKRGLATGGNEFFILTRERTMELGLPMKFCRPILPSPRHLPVNEIYADEQGNPLIAEPLYLLDCRLPEEVVRTQYPKLWAYYEQGRVEMAERYLCQKRSPWYAQENREASPFICTYMGRGKNGTGHPFRFILNHSSAIVANSYLALYPKPATQMLLRADPTLKRKLWEALNEIGKEAMLEEGRVYGGGLYKIEPKELAKVSALPLLKILKTPTHSDLLVACA